MIATLLLTFALASAEPLATPSARPEIHDFTGNEWIYVGGAKAAMPEASIPSCALRPAEIQDPVHPACLPDPFETLCRINSEQARRRWAKTRERAVALSNRLDALFEKHRPEVDRTVGKLDDHPTDLGFYNRWKTAMEERVRDELAAPEAKSVRRNVRRAFEIYDKMLRESRLPTHLVDSLSAYLQSCTENPRLQITQGEGALLSLGSYNATATIIGWQLEYGNTGPDRRMKIRDNPAVSCALQLHGQAWLDCAEGNPSCYQTVFHEIAHYMNSCVLRHMALVGEEHFTWFQRLVKPGVDRTQSTLRHGYEVLKERTACLAELSAPKNTWFAPGNYPKGLSAEMDPERCVPSGKYHSQWYEAESDFWGASAEAVYLRDLSAPERRKVFGENIAMWCSEVLDPTPVETSRYQAYLIANYPNQVTGMTDLGVGMEPPKARPSPKPMPKPWDAHQDWEVRVNRNILRNSDLRQALGCTVSRVRSGLTDIPVACSPNGTVQRLFP